jgi:ABC transporter substrate binding protein (PQQ-dependent alcohol dehydrogenase system)
MTVPAAAQTLPSPMQEAQAKHRTEIKIGYISQPERGPLPASRMQTEPDNIGIAGAEQALKEDNAAGQFTGDLYTIDKQVVSTGGDPKAALQKLLDQKIHYIIVDAPPATLLALADAAKGKDVLLFNIRDREVSLRQQDCRRDVLHVAPSHAMLADALAQYLITEKWKNWLLVTGPTPVDKDYAEAMKRAAKRFGAVVVAERDYKETPGEDRDKVGAIPPPPAGSANAAPDYDVIVVADEEHEWSPYTPYRGAGGPPRPVAGTAGLVATSWSPAHSKWGARQLNMHFEEAFHRYMTPVDYAGYVAARTVGEAVTRRLGGDFASIDSFIRSPRFQLNAFKGVRHTYRPWDGQLRDPILIVANDVVVSVSPQPGFHDPKDPDDVLDTLGVPQRESTCKMENVAQVPPAQ